VSLAAPDSISTSTPYCPTNAKVLEVMAKFQCKSNTEQQQLNIAALSAPEVDNSNNSQIQQLHGDDREGAGCGSVYFVDSPLQSTTFVDSGKSIGEKATNAVDISDDGTRVVGCCSYITESLTATSTVSPARVKRERLTTEAAGAWQRPRGRGRGRIISLSASGSDVSDAAVGSQSMGTTSRVGGGRIGRGRARSIMRQSFICTEKDSSTERVVGSSERENGAETNESYGAIMFPKCEHSDPERSVGVTEAGALGVEELQGARISKDLEFGSDIVHKREFGDGHFRLTSTPSHSETISNESQFLAESLATPPTRELHNMSSPAVVTQSCQGCKALQVSNQRINSTVAEMETKISKLSETVTELNERINQISKQKISKSSFRQSAEVFTDKRLMRIKAAAFITGRPLSAHTCKQLVLNINDNEPPCTFNSDDIKLINDHRECRDAQSLSKWAVFEMFSLQELVGRNCLGGGRDASVDGNGEMKKPFDECKMQIIKNAVFQLYPQQNDPMRKAVWMKCVEKINTDVRYLFKVSLKKPEWLQLGI